MIKNKVADSLQSIRQKYVKKSFSLKKTMIIFPFNTQIPTQSLITPQVKKNANSPSIKSSQIMKRKAQRQQKIKKFNDMVSNPQKSSNNRYGRNSEIVIKRSNSMKLSSTKFSNHLKDQTNKQLLRRTISNNQKAFDANDLLGQSCQSIDTLRKTISIIETNQKLSTQRNQRYDHKNYSQDLFSCRSLIKSTEIQFCNEQIAALVNKKKLINQQKQEDSCDETSFKYVLQRIKSKDLAQLSKNSLQQQKLKYADKVKLQKIYTSPKQIDYNLLISNPSLGKNLNSVRERQRAYFQQAVQWSNKQALIMKRKSVTSNKERNKTSQSKKIPIEKKNDQIKGWER